MTLAKNDGKATQVSHLGTGGFVPPEDLSSALLRCLEAAQSGLPREDLSAFIGQLEAIKAAAFARLVAPVEAAQNHDQLVDIVEASGRLGMSRDYLYRHKRKFPFVKQEGRKVLFSAQGIEKWIAAKK